MLSKQVLFKYSEESNDHKTVTSYGRKKREEEQTWFLLSRCPLCGSKDDCLINSEGTEVICKHTLSTRKVGFHSWLHHLTKPRRVDY
ncbi:hypothetical protein [Lactobacillus kefiranofaciens]|uniref:Transposase n=1 Tax=Lactobacillus kefiranofaciens TaxID=267818 RepID=A0AAX3UEA8_9LACO|nr:hypothetical protein [Lactobacillus kefiranofaciens]AEG41740.1 hypothetical protein WANG_p1137 [Lactobacillus kefiranofaciens subsp. kefiranofaciens]KRM21809.1 hypothetical protein FC93_GL000351 [Lactobacillus kefiranofaciens subsp. kefiranofaciens DSM 5016 = JCM 6985]QFQ68369.1 hypothetical protein LKK75_08275 [Lactobacillus kefiranofaciens subsp. kefiranofaciens]WGO85839.1 hypothetical protein QEJ78_11135 [Lactobacillus kefiranofaciens]WQH36841.1 hypothetical protein U2870_04320 [Lactobac